MFQRLLSYVHACDPIQDSRGFTNLFPLHQVQARVRADSTLLALPMSSEIPIGPERWSEHHDVEFEAPNRVRLHHFASVDPTPASTYDLLSATANTARCMFLASQIIARMPLVTEHKEIGLCLHVRLYFMYIQFTTYGRTAYYSIPCILELCCCNSMLVPCGSA
jgi:hypothetical protein